MRRTLLWLRATKLAWSIRGNRSRDVTPSQPEKRPFSSGVEELSEHGLIVRAYGWLAIDSDQIDYS